MAAAGQATPWQIGVLSNAGSAHKRRRAAMVDNMLRCRPGIVHRLTANESEICSALGELAASGTNLLAINGGDGTVAHVLTALLNGCGFAELPTLALLPGGSSNIAAGDCGFGGFGGSLAQAVLQLCRCSAGRLNTRLLSRPALSIYHPKRPAPLHGLVFGAGAVVEGIEFWHDQVKARGLRGPGSSFVAMLGTLRGILREDGRFLRPVPIRLRYPDADQALECDAKILVVSSLERMFFGVRPYWDDGGSGLHSTVIRARAERFARMLPAILRGRRHPLMTAEAGYYSQRSPRLELQMNGRFTLDGDLYALERADGPLVLQAGPLLRFLQPA